MVDGSGLGSAEEAAAIHQQNAAALAAMTEEERLASQQQLVSSIDPKLLEFIRKRRAAAVPEPAERTPLVTKSPPVQAGPDTVMDQPSGESISLSVGEVDTPMEAIPASDAAMAELEKVKDQLPIDLDEARSWPHMDKIEPEKLLWMTKLPAPKVEIGQSGFTARFDFEGGCRVVTSTSLFLFSVHTSAAISIADHTSSPCDPACRYLYVCLQIISRMVVQRTVFIPTVFIICLPYEELAN